jgi:hypothetical protein
MAPLTPGSHGFHKIAKLSFKFNLFWASGSSEEDF